MDTNRVAMLQRETGKGAILYVCLSIPYYLAHNTLDGGTGK